MDELKKKIDLSPISDEIIKEKKFTLKDLWMVKDEENDVYGPYDTKSLREYSHKYEYLFEVSKIYNLKEEKWFEIFSLPIFQRRKPKLVPSQNLIKEYDFYILHNGLKKGPYSKEQVQSLLDKGQILPSIQISLDIGASWIKLYEHHAFDRRTKKATDHLPYIPEKKILDKVTQKKQAFDAVEQDALIDLAYIGQSKDNQEGTKTFIASKLPKEVSKQFKNQTATQTEPSGSSKLVASAISLMVLIAIGVAGNYMFKSFDDIKVEKKEVVTDKSSINNSSRSIQKRAPASRKNNTVKVKRYTPPIKRSKPKRFNRKKTVIKSHSAPEVFEQEVEKLDINDPEVQEELTRQLAGEYDLDGEPIEEPQDIYDRDLEPQPEMDPYLDDQEPVEHYNDEGYEEAP